ncbi:MAG: TRAP transporter small permease [Thermomonas sp.]
MTELASEQAVGNGALDRLASIAAGIAGAALLLLVATQMWQVIARYVFNNSPSWTEPVSVVLLSAAMSFGAAAGVHERRHFAFGLLAEHLPAALRRGCEWLGALTIVLIGAVIAWWGARLYVDGYDIPMAGAPVSQGLPYLPLAIGGALMVLFALAQLRGSDRAAGQVKGGTR